MTTVAVMQPYWIPYGGYFRLFAEADVFVMFDDVQFPRRGYVHRNKLTRFNQEPDWISLPIEKAARNTEIRHLRFREHADELLEGQRLRFPMLANGFGLIDEVMKDLNRPVVDVIIESLEIFRVSLQLHCSVLRSSELGEQKARGQERILRMVKALGGDVYLNSPGGRNLYQWEDFARENIELRFLSDWQSNGLSILETYSDPKVRAEISGS